MRKATSTAAASSGNTTATLDPKAASNRRAPARAILSRDDLSFTLRVNGEGRLHNWVVPHDDKAYWDPCVSIGRHLFEEVEALAEVDELAAFQAMVFALNTPTWSNYGAGIEYGFSEAMAALAILGMRSLLAGADRFDFELETRRSWAEDDCTSNAEAKGVRHD